MKNNDVSICNKFDKKIGVHHKTIILLLLIGSCLYSSISHSQNIDINLLKEINLNRNRSLDAAFRNVTNSVTPIAYGIPLVLYGTGLIKKDSLFKQKAIYLAASLLTSAAITTIFKYSINRKRPFVSYPFIEKLTEAGSPSFPSGHTSDAFALATSLSLNYREWYIIAPSYLWAFTAGYSRMHLGVHYPSDVLAGALIGAGSAYLCYKGKQWLNSKTKCIQ